MNDKDKKFLLVLIGLTVMIVSVMLFIFIPRTGGNVSGEVLLFMVGFGCCIAGSETDHLRGDEE